MSAPILPSFGAVREPPPLARAAPAAGMGSEAQRLAWQREMERAASEAWFRAAPSTDDARADDAVAAPARPTERMSVHRSPIEPQSGRSAGFVPSVQQATPRFGAGHIAPSPDLASDGAAAGEASAPAGLPERRLRDASAARPATEGSVTAAATTTAPEPAGIATTRPVSIGSSVRVAEGPSWSGEPTAAVAQPNDTERLQRAARAALGDTVPIRLHVEWRGDAATVWIGLDRGAADSLPALIDALSRWMVRAGVRLRSVVCNGTTRYSQPAVERDVGLERPASAAPPRITDVDVIVEKEH